MDAEALALARSLIPKSYVSQAEASLSVRRKLVKTLLSQRCMPEQGWGEASIEYFLQAITFFLSRKTDGALDL